MAQWRPCSLCGVIYTINTLFGAGIAIWQLVALGTMILLFASPAHAIFAGKVFRGEPF